jgi:hypothetical protein
MFVVYLAYRYYLSLFEKIKRTSSQKIMKKRVRIPNSQKILVAFKSYIRYKSAYL